MSSKEQARRERNRVRINLRRQKETEEERSRRLEAERIRAAQRRLNESEAERERRRYKSRVRGVERRRNETEEERARRRAMNRARMAEARRSKKKAYENELFGESPEPPENDEEYARGSAAPTYVAIRPRTDKQPHAWQQTASRSYEPALNEAAGSGAAAPVSYTQQSAWPSYTVSQVPSSLNTAALGYGVVQQHVPMPLTTYPGIATSLGSAAASQTLTQNPLALHQQQYLQRAYSLSTRPVAASGHDTRLQQQPIPLFHTLASQTPAPHQASAYFRQLQLDISKINHRPL